MGEWSGRFWGKAPEPLWDNGKSLRRGGGFVMRISADRLLAETESRPSPSRVEGRAPRQAKMVGGT